MRTASRRILETGTSWPFPLALTVLLVNDLILKAAYPGFVTGKLSDFAGLAVVGLILFSLFPRSAGIVYFGVSATFLWWKSPLSSIFLDRLNAFGFGTFGRTVDYTDLIALSVLPFCASIARRANAYAVPWITWRSILAAPIAAGTFVALLGTSMVQTRQEYLIRDASSGKELERSAVVAAIRSVAETNGLRCQNCDPSLGSVLFVGNSIEMSYEFGGPNTVLFKIWASANCLFFCATGEEKADALRRSLKAEFAKRFRELEYVERLPTQVR